MRERKKTVVHGTLEMILLAWKFNSKQLLSKTLNSRMNIIETRAVLNIVKTDGNWAPEGKREGLVFKHLHYDISHNKTFEYFVIETVRHFNS